MKINEKIESLFNDFGNPYVPKNIENFDKVKCEIRAGQRIYWYYKEDEDYLTEEGDDNINQNSDIFSGIVVPMQGIINRGGIGNVYEDYEELMVVVDQYPVEKEYPEIDWVALNRLLDSDDLVKVF